MTGTEPDEKEAITMRGHTPVAALLLVGAAGLAACSGGTAGLTAGDRTVSVAAIEPKGTTNLEKEAFPTDELPPGGGYKLEAPNEDGDWVASTYMFLPSEITVVEGDSVSLEYFGVNGASHPVVIEGYDIEFEVNRGKLTTVEFVADTPGTFRIACTVHQPAMNGTLVVLPA